ncbi:MAG: histidinol-phosphate transaminase [Bdellovibrionota bacterium]
MIVPKHIQGLQPYKPGKSIRDAAKEFGISKWIKLASNENPLGVAPAAKKAATEAIDEGYIYPHPRSPELLEVLSKKFNRKEDEIIVGNGIDALLAYIIMAFTTEGEEILTSEGSFIGTYVNVNKLGRSLKTVPLKNWEYDLDALYKAGSDKTKIIYLSNPNNPTGSAFGKQAWEKFLNSVPKNVLIILDEAYYEYACGHKDYPNGLDYPLDRLIVTRTMSKAYGMANFRVGYAFSSPEIIQQIQKVKLPFEPSTISVKAAAAALLDEDFLEKTQKLNEIGLGFFAKEFKRLGISFKEETFGNFIMMIFENEAQALKFNDECLKKGLILRPLGSFGIPQGVRINTGTIVENKHAMAIIEKVFNEIK